MRNLRFTAPYMHNGSLSTLKQVLEFYEDISNGKERNPLVSKEQFNLFVRELNLSVKEMSLIISFLNTLNDYTFSKDIPETAQVVCLLVEIFNKEISKECKTAIVRAISKR